MNMHKLSLGGVVLTLALGCADYRAGERADASETATLPFVEALVAEPDTTGAAIWEYLTTKDYRDAWETWPGKGTLYSGGAPHGMLLTTYLNETAMAALDSGLAVMPPGAVIVKDNFMPDSTLAAVTVMYKAEGFNAEFGDWFFSKHLPGGALDTMPNGMSMEGRVTGCENCHQGARDNDFILTAPIAATDGGV